MWRPRSSEGKAACSALVGVARVRHRYIRPDMSWRHRSPTSTTRRRYRTPTPRDSLHHSRESPSSGSRRQATTAAARTAPNQTRSPTQMAHRLARHRSHRRPHHRCRLGPRTPQRCSSIESRREPKAASGPRREGAAKAGGQGLLRILRCGCGKVAARDLRLSGRVHCRHRLVHVGVREAA